MLCEHAEQAWICTNCGMVERLHVGWTLGTRVFCGCGSSTEHPEAASSEDIAGRYSDH